MTREDKQLLLVDLCARLPYDVIVVDHYGFVVLFTWKQLKDFEDGYISKPYLRPMSSMTEDEKHELLKFGTVNLDRESNAIDVCCVGFNNHAKVQDYLNSIHIDYRGLIPKGLAIEVTEENNPYKE